MNCPHRASAKPPRGVFVAIAGPKCSQSIARRGEAHRFTGERDTHDLASATLWSHRSRVRSCARETAATMADVESQSEIDTAEFRELEVGPWRIVICESLVESFRSLAHSIDFAAQKEAHSLGTLCEDASGRGRNALVELPGHPERLNLRPLRHGGILAPITGTRFAGLERPLAELRLSAELTRRGAPVPTPAFVVGRRAGIFWQAAFATIHIEDAQDGVVFLDGEPDDAALERAARAAGASIRRLHDFGCCHADLHIKNLLIREMPTETRVTIIDLDRAKLVNDVSAGRRMQELMRLRRSLIKRGYANALSPQITQAFSDAYSGNDTELRDQLLARGRIENLRGRAHAMFYRAP